MVVVIGERPPLAGRPGGGGGGRLGWLGPGSQRITAAAVDPAAESGQRRGRSEGWERWRALLEFKDEKPEASLCTWACRGGSPASSYAGQRRSGLGSALGGGGGGSSLRERDRRRQGYLGCLWTIGSAHPTAAKSSVLALAVAEMRQFRRSRRRERCRF